jgi:hypothetical protein
LQQFVAIPVLPVDTHAGPCLSISGNTSPVALDMTQFANDGT